MILGLIFLPIRIALNLARILIKLALSLFWLPIHLITRHFFLFVMLAIAIVVFAMFAAHKEDKAANQLPQAPTVSVDPTLTPGPATAPAATAPRGKAAPVKIDPVMKVEDGDSAFATDLIKAMTDPERAAYSAYFYYAMNTLGNGQAYQWANGNINGTIMPTSSFTNHVGDRCRSFKEVLKVHTVEQKLTGTSCDNNDGSWCKLKPNATPMCGLGGGQPSMVDSVKDSVRRLFH